MLARLAKLAARSAQLRKMAMKKEAILGALASGVGRWAMRNPGKAAIGGLAAVSAPGTVSGTYRQHMAGFNPDVQQAMRGSAPVPPGAQ